MVYFSSLPPRLMSCKLSDIARAKSSSDTVANASSISLDIFSRSPHCTSGLLTDPGDHGLALPYDACDRDSDGGLSPNRIPPAKCGDVGWSLPPLPRGSPRGVWKISPELDVRELSSDRGTGTVWPPWVPPPACPS